MSSLTSYEIVLIIIIIVITKGGATKPTLHIFGHVPRAERYTEVFGTLT